jgi:hypothetical protein
LKTEKPVTGPVNSVYFNMEEFFKSILIAIVKTSSWWLIITIPGVLLVKFILPWVLGPAGVPAGVYFMGIINPIKYGVAAGRGKGRFFYLLCFFISLIYQIVYYFLIFVNIIFLIKPLL